MILKQYEKYKKYSRGAVAIEFESLMNTAAF